MITYGIDMHFTTPYRSESNGRCERHVQEFNKILRLVSVELPREEIASLIPLAVCLLNAQPRLGLSAFEIFHHGRPQWLDFGITHGLITEDFPQKFESAAEKVRKLSVAQRQWRAERHEAHGAVPPPLKWVISPWWIVEDFRRIQEQNLTRSGWGHIWWWA